MEFSSGLRLQEQPRTQTHEQLVARVNAHEQMKGVVGDALKAKTVEFDSAWCRAQLDDYCLRRLRRPRSGATGARTASVRCRSWVTTLHEAIPETLQAKASRHASVMDECAGRRRTRRYCNDYLGTRRRMDGPILSRWDDRWRHSVAPGRRIEAEAISRTPYGTNNEFGFDYLATTWRSR